MPLRLFLCGLLLTIGAACSRDEPSAPENPDRSQVLTGVIVAIDGEGIEDVDSFTLRVDGTNHKILIDPGHEYGFALGHLHAHLQGAEPVEVTYEEREGELVALSIEDA